MIPDENAWMDVGAIAEIALLGARQLRTSAGCVVVFRTGEAEAFAIDERCPHKGGPLAQGTVHGRFVTCPLHKWVVNLETGQAQGPEEGQTDQTGKTGQVRTFPLRVEGGRILLERAAMARRRAQT